MTMDAAWKLNKRFCFSLTASAKMRGVSLVELMIAMAISLFVIGALLGVVMGASSTSKSRDVDAELQNNGRYAIEVIKNDLLHSGYLGVSSRVEPDVNLANIPDPGVAITVVNPCDIANLGKLAIRVQGYSPPIPLVATCLGGTMYKDGDVLMVRGLAATPEPPGKTLVAGRIYFYSTYYKGMAFLGGTTPPALSVPGTVPPQIHALIENVFYVNPATGTETPPIPALHRLHLGVGPNGPAMIDELVAGGVETMGLSFGQMGGDLTTAFLPAKAVTEWDRVNSVRVWLLLRSSKPEAGYSNTTTYNVGDRQVIAADGYHRLLLDTVVSLRN